jgi:hypothetical protein
MPLLNVVLAASVATAPVAQSGVAVVPDNWADTAKAPLVDDSLIRRAAVESIALERELAAEQSKAAAIPQRLTLSSQPDIGKYEKFAQEFDGAKVPGCLNSDGLKRQPTFIFGGLLALPFIAVAKVRGKCN